MHKVILCSGGIDSFIMYEWLLSNKQLFDIFTPLYIDYGQKYVKAELEALNRLIPNIEVIRVQGTPYEEINSGFTPARNLFLASIAVMYANADIVYMAGLKDDNVSDKNPEAFEQMGYMLSKFSRKKIIVDSPFFDVTKAQIVSKYLAAGGSPDKLRETFSCYAPIREKDPCYNCPACFRRWVALTANGISMPPINRDIVLKYLKKLNNYCPERVNATLAALNVHFRDGIYLIDIDNILTAETSTSGVPNYKDYHVHAHNAAAVRAIYHEHKDVAIILYTSRWGIDRYITEQWLAENQIPYHALLMDKPFATKYIDDKAVNSLDFT